MCPAVAGGSLPGATDGTAGISVAMGGEGEDGTDGDCVAAGNEDDLLEGADGAQAESTVNPMARKTRYNTFVFTNILLFYFIARLGRKQMVRVTPSLRSRAVSERNLARASRNQKGFWPRIARINTKKEK